MGECILDRELNLASLEIAKNKFTFSNFVCVDNEQY